MPKRENKGNNIYKERENETERGKNKTEKEASRENTKEEVRNNEIGKDRKI